MINIFKEAKTLHDLGLAVHWLHPKSKRPIDLKWTTGPKKSWGVLSSQYKPGMNLGVRLGAATPLNSGNYLAVIDCDVKSTDPVHEKEMTARLRELFPKINFDAGLKVLSGRGNGSRHLYVQTKEPQKPLRLAQAPHQLKVFMPSIKTPSGNDRKHLTAAELKAGWRMRAAWEISIMGEGQQVVLPSSTHPDTGGLYKWEGYSTPKVFRSLPVVNVKAPEKEFTDVNQNGAVKFTTVNLKRLTEKTRNLILAGEGCSGDKSSSLFGACMAMARASYTDDEILSVATDLENYLGEVGFNHAKTKDRARAAEWVRKYSLAKARHQISAARDFENVAVMETNRDPEELKSEHQALITESRDWTDEIERGSAKEGAKPKNTVSNVVLILTNVFAKNIFIKNLFSGLELFGCDMKLETRTIRAGSEITDSHIAEIKYWCARHYRFEPSNDRIDDAIKVISSQNSFHPVRDYLETLEWDGTPRIDGWLTTYLGAIGPSSYLSAVGRKVLCAMVARVYRPGCKFDQVLILEGAQGIGKSTAARILASDPWFTDSKLNITNKDAVLTMAAVWIVELGELSGMRKADVDDLKEFISRQSDRIRLPYGKKIENFPRQCVFIGTTNGDEYLRDTSGNRRFWPVRVGECHLEKLARDRAQLLAEAKVCFEFGEPLYLEDRAERELAMIEQSNRVPHDPWVDVISEFLRKPENAEAFTEFQIQKLFSAFGPLAEVKENMQEIKRASNVLREIGYENSRGFRHGFRVSLWHQKSSEKMTPKNGEKRGENET